MDSDKEVLGTYFGVLTKADTYLNTIFLLLSFPLGIAYFVFLIVGFSLGLSLIIIWVGLLILALLFPLIWVLIAFERLQAINLLKMEIAPMSYSTNPSDGLWERTKAFFTNPVTWKGLLYLFSKFPIGIVEFIILTLGISLSFGLILSPLAYPWVTINIGFWIVDSFSEALGVAVVGILILPAVFHAFNFVAQLNGKFAKVMLGRNESVTIKSTPVLDDNKVDQSIKKE